MHSFSTPVLHPAINAQKEPLRSVVCECLQSDELSRSFSFAAHKVTTDCFVEGDLLDGVCQDVRSGVGCDATFHGVGTGEVHSRRRTVCGVRRC